MSIEQHAGAAAKDLWSRLVDESPPFNRLTRDERKAIMRTIITRHMQAASDEAAAALKARIAELEGLGPMIEDLIPAVSWREYSETCVPKAFREADEALRELVDDIRNILKGGAK